MKAAYRRLPDDGRTQDQRDANKIDCDLYRLIGWVAQLEARPVGAKGRLACAHAHHLMTQARRHIRELMHPDDRKGTEG